MWLKENYFYNSFEKLNSEKIILLNKLESLKLKITKQENDIKLLKETNQTIQIKQKVIKIILPEHDINYSQIIPKEDYSFLENDKTKDNKKESNIKILPSIIFDKEKKEIDTIKIDIKTKF